MVVFKQSKSKFNILRIGEKPCKFINLHSCVAFVARLPFILRNRVEYRLILSRHSARLSRIIVLFFNKLITKLTILSGQEKNSSMLVAAYKITYIAGYLLPTDDRYWENHDHIWTVLQYMQWRHPLVVSARGQLHYEGPALDDSRSKSSYDRRPSHSNSWFS